MHQAAAINAQPAKFNAQGNIMGSRFNSLLENTVELDKETIDNEENVEIIELEGEENQGGSQRDQIRGIQNFKNKRANGGVINRRGDSGVDRNIKESKLATRGGNFKGKNGSHGKRGVDSILEKGGVELLGKVLGHDNQPIYNTFTNNGEESRPDKNIMDTDHEGSPGQVANPNVPRPPNWAITPPKLLSQTTIATVEEQVGDGEIFVDAHDQGSVGSQDSDMEVVAETLSLS
jgi:hypothetical protein